MLMFPVFPLKVKAFEVVELVVEALEVMKLEEEPKRVAIVPLVAVRFVNIAVTALRREE